jgi:hypothetical protein
MNSNTRRRGKPSIVKSRILRRADKPAPYPDKTPGSKLAAEVRSKANNISEEERASLSDLGKELIYGGKGSRETVRARH